MLQISQEVFPYPPYDTTKFNTIFFIPMPAIIVLGFMFIVPSIMRNVVSERQTGIKASEVLIEFTKYMRDQMSNNKQSKQLIKYEA